MITDPSPYVGTPSFEAMRVRCTEERLYHLCRFLIAEAERPDHPLRRDLIALASQVQRIQRRALSVADRL